MEFEHPMLLVLLHHLTPRPPHHMSGANVVLHTHWQSRQNNRGNLRLADAAANCCSFLTPVQQFMNHDWNSRDFTLQRWLLMLCLLQVSARPTWFCWKSRSTTLSHRVLKIGHGNLLLRLNQVSVSVINFPPRCWWEAPSVHLAASNSI